MLKIFKKKKEKEPKKGLTARDPKAGVDAYGKPTQNISSLSTTHTIQTPHTGDTEIPRLENLKLNDSSATNQAGPCETSDKTPVNETTGQHHQQNPPHQTPPSQSEKGSKKAQPANKITPDDFEPLKVVGKGTFGKVVLARKCSSGHIYAMKIIKKKQLQEMDEIGHTKSERRILESNQAHPFLIDLKYSFQTRTKVYLVFDFVCGGELFHHLSQEGKFSEDRAVFYATQLVMAIGYLHSKRIMYRDLKPENVLIDQQGYVALCDFGLCKENIGPEDTSMTFCGTPEYMAPEVLLHNAYGPAVDWWTIGILIYEMLFGLPPFFDEDHDRMYDRILNEVLQFPSPETGEPLSFEEAVKQSLSAAGQAVGYPSHVAIDLCARLLQKEPSHRLGYGKADYLQLLSHPFFRGVNIEQLYHRKLPAPWIPDVSDVLDTRNFDDEFTTLPVQESYEDDSFLSQTLQNNFAGFTYQPDPQYLK